MKAVVLEIAGAGALEGRLARTLRDLAALGDKRAGSPGGAASAAYIAARFRAAGLETQLETFRFPAFVLHGSSLQVGERSVAHGALAYSGCGAAEGVLMLTGQGQVGGTTSTKYSLSVITSHGRIVRSATAGVQSAGWHLRVAMHA